jgi:hypothetical protein
LGRMILPGADLQWCRRAIIVPPSLKTGLAN